MRFYPVLQLDTLLAMLVQLVLLGLMRTAALVLAQEQALDLLLLMVVRCTLTLLQRRCELAGCCLPGVVVLRNLLPLQR